MLASGAGIVAIGIVRTVRDREAVERELRGEVERGARSAALALADALRSGTFTEFAQEDGRLRIEKGRVVGAASRATSREETTVATGTVLDEARRAEFGQADRSAARALLTAALGSAPEPGPLVLALAWLEDRAADTKARDTWLADPRLPRTASAALLVARSQRTFTDWQVEALQRLAPDEALAVLDHLCTSAPGVVAAAAALRERFAFRAVREQAVRVLEDRASTDGPVVARIGEHLLLGRLDHGTGDADLCAARPLLAALAARSPVPWTGTPVLAQEAKDDSVVAIPGVVAIALPDTTAGLAPPANRTLGLLAVLVATFVLGGAFAFRALRRESRAMAARAEFLTSVTHELKTPLAGIRLLAEVLEEGRVASEDKRAEYHHRIAAETMRLTTLIENVLDLGRIERGERAYDLRTTDLREIVREVHGLFEVVAERDGLGVTLVTDATPALARVDRGALAQTLWNLLDNARKYARDGGPIALTQAAGIVTVRDHGPGVEVAERERIFAKFTRGARQQDGSVPGLGLGLHLARAIAEAHGGTLLCRAPADGGPGAEFVLTLPPAGGEP